MGICLFFSGKSLCQTMETVQQINNMLDDMVYYSERYITPATDGAVYQAASGWMTSPKKRKLFDVTLGLHGNVFFVPKEDRSFGISNSDFKFFTIENAESAIVPTALGEKSAVYLSGQVDDTRVRIKAPDGVNQEAVFYPYLQGLVALWKGFEVVGKFSTKVKLKSGDYQVYGAGLKHNLSQYLKPLEKHHINLAALVVFSKEDIEFDFLNTTVSGSPESSQILSKITTTQFQMSASKTWNNFELMVSSMTNRSDFKYYLNGNLGTMGGFLPLDQILNERLKQLYTTKINCIGEISGRYQFGEFYVQTLIAFGKFANLNLAIQYEF